MTVFVYILFSMAMGIQALLVLRSSASHVSVRLGKGLLISAIIAVVGCALLLLGVWLAGLWRYRLRSVDAYTFLGIMLLLVVKMLLNVFGKQRGPQAYDISRMATVALLAVALGLDCLIGGMAFGFLDTIAAGGVRAGVSLGVAVFMLSYLGVMLGRRHVEVRQRRWQLFSVLFVLATVFIALQRSL